MPVPSPLDPEAVTALAERLVRARDEVTTASGELLEHFVDVGDGATQLAVELLADHAADALRALDDALGESARALPEVTGGTCTAAARPRPRTGWSPAGERPAWSGATQGPARGWVAPCAATPPGCCTGQQTLERSVRELRASRGPEAVALRTRIAEQARLLGAVAADLDRAGAALQRYATDLAQALELSRRAEESVRAAGLRLEGTRVVEAWGPTGAPEAERRRALLPECQARVDRATSLVGRARATLQRAVAELVPAFTGSAAALRGAPGTAPPPG